MLKRLMIGAALVCLIGGGAYAQDEEQMMEPAPAPAPECEEQLSRTEEIVHDRVEANALSEAEAEQVYLLLDEADALCNEGNGAEASAKLADVNKIVTKGN
jgi:hypothetical protein